MFISFNKLKKFSIILKADNRPILLDMDEFIRSQMQKTVGGDWQCCYCGRQSKVKTNIFEHIEASHVETPGYVCDLCSKLCRTRNALRAHKHREHNSSR